MKIFRSKFNSYLILFLLIISLCSALVLSAADLDNALEFPQAKEKYEGTKAKYVFFFIGDGMGLVQLNSAELFLTSTKSDRANPVKLNFTEFPAQGLATTYSSNSFITDSAAAGTALSTGYKTKSGVVGMDETRRKKLKSIAYFAKEKGMKVGILSSVSLDHATPACFYAQTSSRSNMYKISTQATESGFDYFAGGDFRGNEPSMKKDKADILELFSEAGYTITSNEEEFQKLKKKDGQKVVSSNSVVNLPYSMDRKEEQISLAEFTEKGIELLDNENGFFMMVEGGKIDWACHANDGAAAIKDTLAFNDAVGKAVEFAKKHPEETLIVVTGDHETGGMTMGFAATKYSTFFEKIEHQTGSYEKFNELLADYKKNHSTDNAKLLDLAPAIKKAFGLIMTGEAETKEEKAMLLNDYEMSLLEDAFTRSVKGEKIKSKDPQTYLLYGGYEPLTVTLTHVLNNKAGLGWTSYSHTAVPVPVFAQGAGAELFNGYYDNTDVAKKIYQAFM